MRSKMRSRNGQTAVLFTLMMVPLFGVLGLVVDVGWSYFRHEAAQTAADSAATAAALAAYQAAAGGSMLCTTTGIVCYASETACPATLPTTPANNVQAGCMYAGVNGFVNTGKQHVTFQTGVGAAPTSPGVTMSYWVVARVKEDIPQLFSAALGFRTASIVARATTGANEATSGGCVITLNPSASASLSLNGGTNLTSGCGVFVNSIAADAITAVGGGTITTNGSAKTEIVGNWSGSGVIAPAPRTGVPYQGDPMADLLPPTYSGCDNAGVNLGSHDSAALTPGVYCGGINLSSHAAITLSPGTYIVKNGISLGAQTAMSGTGVTIYLQSGGVTMAGGASVNLTAPSSGAWQGILFFQDRLDTTDSTLVGGTTQQMNGALYFPKAHLNYTGGSGVTATATTIISDTLTLVGNSTIAAAASTRFTGNSGGVSLIQ
jgi:Flp pilus assembly protein TadG